MRIGPLLREAWQLTWRNKRLMLVPLLGMLPPLLVIPLLVLYGPVPLRDYWSTESELLWVLPASFLAAIVETLVIVAVRRARAERPGPPPLHVLRARWKSALGVMIVGGLTGLLSGLALGLPGWMSSLGIAQPVVIVSAVLLALPYAALEITRGAWIQFGLRHAVIEDVDALPALIRGWRFLRGRIVLALKLHVTSSLIMIAVSATYLVPAAIVLFAVLVMHASFPIAIVLVPVFAVALPVFSLAAVLQSALYTLSFLDERAIR